MVMWRGTGSHSKTGPLMAELKKATGNWWKRCWSWKRARLRNRASRDGNTSVETLPICNPVARNGPGNRRTAARQSSGTERTVDGIRHLARSRRCLPCGSFVVACICSLGGRSCVGVEGEWPLQRKAFSPRQITAATPRPGFC